MASAKQYSSELKAKVAREALDQPSENLPDLAEKYGVPVSAVKIWATQLENEGPEAFQEPSPETPTEEDEQSIADHETVDIEISKSEISESIGYGVMKDRLNYKRLVFWSVLGTVLFIIFVSALVEMFQYNAQVSRTRVLENSQYYNVTQQKREAEETLNSFGVVDIENGIYRIPIDSAINELAVEGE